MTSTTDGLQSLAFITILGAICAFACFSNIIVIVITYLKKTLKSCTDIFIINLAVSDVLLAGLALPLKLNNAARSLHKHDFSGGNIGCKLVMSVPLLTITCSISTMVVMSFDRHVSIVYQKNVSQRQAVLLVLGVWVISMVMSGPQIYEYSTYEKEEEGENYTEIACGSHNIEENFETIYACFVVALCYVLPVFLILMNYVRVLVFLKKVTRESSIGQNVASVVNKATVNVLRMLITITAVFALLWLPFFVLFTMEEITGTDDSSDAEATPNVVKQLFVALSTISNPVLYLIFSGEYRNGLLNLIRCDRQRANLVVPSSFFASRHNQNSITQLTVTSHQQSHCAEIKE